jgi:alpha-D-ribose 1-methylphosphonate 5-triphosphate synthase subunit PhnH
MTAPPRTNEEAQAHATFTAIMRAMSYPGRQYQLPVSGDHALLAIAEALVDLETSYYTPDPALDLLIARTGGRRRPSDSALYQFFPQLGAADHQLLAHIPHGTLRDPDQSATLVAGCALGEGALLRLSGPGIPSATELRVGGLPHGFWVARQRSMRYPLGWDLVLVAGSSVVALPRTTLVEEVG